MEELEKAARNYHEAHRAVVKAGGLQDIAYRVQANTPCDVNTILWLESIRVQRAALRDEAVALGALMAAALLVPEVF